MSDGNINIYLLFRKERRKNTFSDQDRKRYQIFRKERRRKKITDEDKDICP